MLEDRVGNCDAEERGFPGGSILPPTSRQRSQDSVTLQTVILLDFFFPPHRATCEILVPHPKIEFVPLAVKLPSPNYWTTREFPI